MNPFKGEVELKAGEASFTLRFSIDAICHLEQATGKGLPILAVEMANPKTMTLTLVREVLHAALRERHPDISLQDAGEMILKAGGMVVVMLKVSEALHAAFPEVAEASGTPRPPNREARRRAGSGKPS